MPSVARELPLDQPPYSNAEFVERRRNILCHARSFSPGPDQHRDALSLHALFKNIKWLDAHTVECFGD